MGLRWYHAAGAAVALALLLGGRRRRKGLWWDMGESQTRDNVDLYLRRLRELGITDVGIMVNSQDDYEDRDFDWEKWTPAGVLWFQQVLGRAGIDAHLVLWPHPARDYIESVLHGPAPTVAQVVRDGRFRSVMLDAEGYNWSDERVRGYRTLDEAAAHLVEGLRAQLPGSVELGVTAHTGRLQPELARRSDYHAVQAYSHYEGGDPDTRFDPRPFFTSSGELEPRNQTGEDGPGNRAIKGFDRLREMGVRRIVIGHAAYDQEGYSDPVAAMRRAAAVAEWLGIPEQWWWSAKWVVGHRLEPWAYEAVRAA